MLKERGLKRGLYQQLRRAGFTQVMANILARRTTDYHQCRKLLQQSLKSLTHPLLLAEMPDAVSRVVQALQQGEVIAIQTDYDCDGQTAHAVMYKALVEIFQHDHTKVLSFIGDRRTEGYGLHLRLAQQIIAQKATLVLTADNGSSDGASLQILAEHGIDVIVTDHHTVHTRPPHLYAFINPAFDNSQFADSAIAGCMVAWLFMAAIYLYVRAHQIRPMLYSVTRLLDYVAVGTLADCVSLLSHNNRIVIRYGLALMNMTHKPIWTAMKQQLQKHSLTRETIQFYIAPLLNAASRMGHALTGLAFLLAHDVATATRCLNTLQSYNLSRQVLQKQALAEAQAQLATQEPSALIFLVLQHSHAGINGIVASQITAQTGKATVILSVDAQCKVTGSLRTTNNLHLVQLLHQVGLRAPQLLLSFGGHRQAAGVALKQEDLPRFRSILNELIGAQSTERGHIWHDGNLRAASLEVVLQQFERLEPFGVDFPAPNFWDSGVILSVQRFGASQQYLSMRIKMQMHSLKMVFFQASEHPWAFTLRKNDSVQIMYTLSRDQYTQEPLGIVQGMTFGMQTTWNKHL